MLYIAIAAVIGLGIGLIIGRSNTHSQREKIEKKASQVLNKAKDDVAKLEETANEEAIKLRTEIAEFDREWAGTLENVQRRVDLKENTLEKREARKQEKEERYAEIAAAVKELEKRGITQSHEAENALLNKTGLEQDNVKTEIKNSLEREFETFFASMIVKTENRAKEVPVKKLTERIKGIIQRYTGPSSVSHLERNVEIKKENTLKQIIGKHGKNLAYLEEVTGTNILVDDVPGHVTVAYFNLYRQEIGRRTVERLKREKVIDPSVIDKAFEEATKETDEVMVKEGIRACEVIGVEKRDEKLMWLIGRMKYRTSYGQNILYHSIEMAFFCAMIAAEMGADVEVAKLAGFFHDIGKAIDQEDDVIKPHDHVSKDILEEFGYPHEIVHAAWAHHDAVPQETVEAHIVKIADAISGSRQGARTESAEQYYERIQALEEIALAGKGVRKAFAVSAGREIRTYVDQDKIKDEELQEIADDLAKNIEENLTYPGKIKVNLIRTVEASDYANRNKK